MEETSPSLDGLDLKGFIIALRGDTPPTRCDFCLKDTPTENLEPEEAGMWICHECMKNDP